MVRPERLGGLIHAGHEDWERGYKYGLAVHGVEAKYQIFPTATKKLIDNIVEILESGNEVMINILKANIKAFLDAVRLAKKNNEDKGGFKNECAEQSV